MHIHGCEACACGNPQRGPGSHPTRPDIAGKPWSEIVIDTLELGADRSGKYHCILVMVDVFTKWAEVVPLR